MDVVPSLAAGAASTAFLAALHLGSGRLRRLPGVPERVVVSFSGGLAAAYVFLHLLPELAEGNRELAEALSDRSQPGPLAELAVFGIALVGFAVFYGMERIGEIHGDRAGSSGLGFATHLGFFAVYNGVITYTMASRFRTGVGFAVLFTVAMGLHFVLTDRGLAEHWPRRFGPRSRLLLTGALVAGWGLSVVFAPTRVLVVSALIAFLAGGVLVNVLKEELPDAGQRSDIRAFVAGLVSYAALLAAVTVVGHR